MMIRVVLKSRRGYHRYGVGFLKVNKQKSDKIVESSVGTGLLLYLIIYWLKDFTIQTCCLIDAQKFTFCVA